MASELFLLLHNYFVIVVVMLRTSVNLLTYDSPVLDRVSYFVDHMLACNKSVTAVYCLVTITRTVCATVMHMH